MRLRMVLVCLIVGGLTTFPDRAQADSSEEAAKLGVEGRACLAKADFEGAKKAFKAAAKADRDNDQYRQLYAVVRRVIKIRESLADEQDLEKWATTASALRGTSMRGVMPISPSKGASAADSR